MSSSDFDRATAVSASDDGWTVDLDGSWSIGGFLNGGYLLAPMARRPPAASLPDILAVTATFLSPLPPVRLVSARPSSNGDANRP